jgi:hypothetical protein
MTPSKTRSSNFEGLYAIVACLVPDELRGDATYHAHVPMKSSMTADVSAVPYMACDHKLPALTKKTIPSHIASGLSGPTSRGRVKTACDAHRER